MNQVFETYNNLPIYGHSFPNGLDFLYVPNADVFIPEDVEVDIVTLALSDTSVTTPGDEYIKGICFLSLLGNIFLFIHMKVCIYIF